LRTAIHLLLTYLLVRVLMSVGGGECPVICGKNTLVAYACAATLISPWRRFSDCDESNRYGLCRVMGDSFNPVGVSMWVVAGGDGWG